MFVMAEVSPSRVKMLRRHESVHLYTVLLGALSGPQTLGRKCFGPLRLARVPYFHMLEVATPLAIDLLLCACVNIIHKVALCIKTVLPPAANVHCLPYGSVMLVG